MPLVPLDIPPGVVKPGTVYDARGRWYVADFIRWHNGVMQPMGGWETLTGATGSDVTGRACGMLAWKRNNGDAKLFIGTHSKAYVYDDGTLTDVTPASGFTAGATDASGTFWSRTEANSWQADTFGEDLLAVAWADGDILEWDSSAGGNMAALSGAPTSNLGVVVTPERFVVALGAGGVKDEVQWSDQEDSTTWTPTSTNQAGSFPLQGDGAIMAGRRGRSETLIWTDIDLHTMRYIGGSLVYSFKPAGTNCGAISRRSMAVVNGWAMWMGQQNFYLYDGSVRPVASEVSDYVFTDLNRTQASKVCAVPFTDFNEIWWFYPSAGSTENDRAVSVNYEEGHWKVIDSFERTAGIDRGFLEYPILADAAGAVYWHEKSSAYVDDGGTPTYGPNAESGPYEIANGDRLVTVRKIIPDEDTLGDAKFSMFSSLYPTDSETEHGPFTVGAPTDVDDRVTGRQVRIKIEHPENKVPFPEALDNTDGWTQNNLSAVNADQATGPDGLSSLEELVEDGTLGDHFVERTAITMTADGTYALSASGSNNTRDWLILWFADNGGGGNIVRAWFDLNNGVVGTSEGTGTGTLDSATMAEDPNTTGLYRCKLVGSVGNGASSIDVIIGMDNADASGGYQGDGSSSLYAGFVLFEDGVSSASPYPLNWRFGTPRIDVRPRGRR